LSAKFHNRDRPTHCSNVILITGDLFIVRRPWQHPPCCDPATARSGHTNVSRLTSSHQQQPDKQKNTSAALVRGKHTHYAQNTSYEAKVVHEGLMKQERDLIW